MIGISTGTRMLMAAMVSRKQPTVSRLISSRMTYLFVGGEVQHRFGARLGQPRRGQHPAEQRGRGNSVADLSCGCKWRPD
jgi:hypothetical protein